MEAGLRGNRGDSLFQIISEGVHTLRPGFEYWVTGAVELWLPPSGRRMIVVENATASALVVTANTPSISGVSGGATYLGSRVVIPGGQRVRFIPSGNGWIASGVVLTQPDPLAASLELALPLNAAVGLIDQSALIRVANNAAAGTTKTVTAFGSAAISTIQSKYYGSSLSLNGTDQYLTVSGSTAPGTGDFCWEGWYFQSATKNSAYLVDTGGGAGLDSFGLYFSTTTNVTVYHGGANRISIASSAGIWNHFALWRLSGVWRIALNGVVSGTTYSSAANLSSTNFFIGNYITPSSIYAFNGNLQDIRYYRTAKYGTTNFTPPGAIV